MTIGARAMMTNDEIMAAFTMLADALNDIGLEEEARDIDRLAALVADRLAFAAEPKPL